MNQIIIEIVFGLISGIFLGITGIVPVGLVLLVLDYMNIGFYKSNLGALMFLNLFPLSIGSFWNFYKADLIDYKMGSILLISVIIGSYLSSKLVVEEKYKLTDKQIKYITSLLGFTVGLGFLISAIYD